MKGKRTVEQATKATVKETKATILVTGRAAQATVKSVQAAVKAVAAAVKTTIATVKGIIALIAAGGWVAVLIILLICVVISEIFDNPFLPLLFVAFPFQFTFRYRANPFFVSARSFPSE